MLLGLLSFISYWAGIVVLTKFQFKLGNMKTYVPDDKRVEFERRIGADKADRLQALYEKVFRTLDIRIVMGVMTDLMLNETRLRIKAYNRLGISRHITFVSRPEKAEDDILTVVNSGKFTTTNEQRSGSYKEQFIDSATGAVLWERDWPKSGFNMCLIRNPEAGRVKELFCEGCGSPITMEGESYICKNCGAKFAADSYEWMISHVSAWNEGIISGAENDDKTIYNLVVKRILPYGRVAVKI